MNKLKTFLIAITLIVTMSCIGNVSALTFERNGETITISDPIDLTDQQYVFGYKTNNNSYMLFVLNETQYQVTGQATTNNVKLSTTKAYVEGGTEPGMLYTYSIANGTWGSGFGAGTQGGGINMSEVIQTTTNVYNLDNMSEVLYANGYGVVSDSNDFDLNSLVSDSQTILVETTTMATTFIGTLWNNPIGKITITMGVIVVSVALGYKIIRRRKKRI